jgi:fluoroacetyl-CoA thioesterase
MSDLHVGLRHSETMVVEPRHTVPEVEQAWQGFVDMPPVFATAMMVGFMEQTCIEALRPFLEPHQHSVGTHVDMNHVAATPVGMKITAEIELIGMEGRALHFKVSCFDNAGLIGEGTHKRAIIDVPRFLDRLKQKTAGM